MRLYEVVGGWVRGTSQPRTASNGLLSGVSTGGLPREAWQPGGWRWGCLLAGRRGECGGALMRRTARRHLGTDEASCTCTSPQSARRDAQLWWYTGALAAAAREPRRLMARVPHRRIFCGHGSRGFTRWCLTHCTTGARRDATSTPLQPPSRPSRHP